MKMKWIYCKDHLPPAGERVLVCTESFVCEAFASFPNDDRYKPVKWTRYGLKHHQFFGQEIIAWMPLPDPPGDRPKKRRLIDIYLDSERERAYQEVCPEYNIPWARRLLENEGIDLVCDDDCVKCWHTEVKEEE